MKSVSILLIGLVIAFRSAAQPAIPFYGFELSNYEVGDSLEYGYHGRSAFSPNAQEQRKWLWKVLAKNPVGPDMLEYVMHRVYWQQMTDNFTWSQTFETVDTVTYSISNDTVYNNGNNLLYVLLLPWDTLYNNGTSYLLFDTVFGMKHLVFLVNGWNVFSYEGTENLGLTSYGIFWEDWAMGYDSYTLIYANLQNYGVYGEHEPIYLSTSQPKFENALVEYDFVNKTLTWKTESIDFDELRLYDLSGRCVINVQPNVGSVSLNHLTPGMYFYQLTGQQFASGKILVR